jgi:ornithine cyclodeaminase
MKLRILSKKEVQRALSMKECIELMKAAFAQLSSGQAHVPLRSQLPVTAHEGVTIFMPAYLAQSGDLGAKIVSVFPRNLKANLPTIHAVVFVIDSRTGIPMALMDGTYLTALRTGAASGAATDLLARKDARLLALFGAGTQARTQLEAVCTVRPITKVLVCDVDPKRAKDFVEEMKSWGAPIPRDIRLIASAEEGVKEADIICTATTSSKPVFDGKALRPGTHINAVGAYTPQMQEVDSETIRRAKVIIDSRQASLAEAGDLIIPLQQGVINEKHIHAEIGEIVAGRKVGRESDSEITYFKSVGVAVQDVAAARRVLDKATELGLGAEVEL